MVQRVKCFLLFLSVGLEIFDGLAQRKLVLSLPSPQFLNILSLIKKALRTFLMCLAINLSVKIELLVELSVSNLEARVSNVSNSKFVSASVFSRWFRLSLKKISLCYTVGKTDRRCLRCCLYLTI